MKKKVLVAIGAIITVILLTLYGPKVVTGDLILQLVGENSIDSTLFQKIEGIYTVPHYVYNVYHENNRIGRLTDLDGIDVLLNEVYEKAYQEEFPNSKLSLNEDIHISKELSYIAYENIDNQILNYIYEHDYFAVEVYKVSFSNGYEIYVKNIEDFNNARDKYVLNFISPEALANIQNNVEIPDLKTYGYQEMGISIKENISISRGYASIDDIYANENDIIYFLSYGYDTEPELYKVEKYDTIEGIAYKFGLEPQHIVTINSDKLSSTDQILIPGMELNVRYYDSPITIMVTKQRLYSEKVYPASTKYVYDATVAEGNRRVIQAEKDGSADILMLETYVNGVLQEELSTKISSTITVAPVQEIVRIGTKYIPGVGTGSFRWPVDNPVITCRWACYYGHRAIDIINRYSSYGKVYAADRGVVYANNYDSISGYYVRINHNNGLISWYGHLRYRSSLTVGQKVEKGQVIGTIGMTGRATGPHVHFRIDYYGTPVNPCKYLGC